MPSARWALRVGSGPPGRLGLLTCGGGGVGQLGKGGCWRLWGGGVRAAHFRVGPSEASDLGKGEKKKRR